MRSVTERMSMWASSRACSLTDACATLDDDDDGSRTRSTTISSLSSMRRSRDQWSACRLYSFRSVATRKVRLSRLRTNPAVVARSVNDCSIPVPPPCDPLAACVASKETRGMKEDEVVVVADVVDVAVDGRDSEAEVALVGRSEPAGVVMDMRRRSKGGEDAGERSADLRGMRTGDAGADVDIVVGADG